MAAKQTLYRLVGLDGKPHPVLDTPYESLDAAKGAAANWELGISYKSSTLESHVGIQVLTTNGSWRTIEYS